MISTYALGGHHRHLIRLYRIELGDLRYALVPTYGTTLYVTHLGIKLYFSLASKYEEALSHGTLSVFLTVRILYEDDSKDVFV